MADYRAVGQRLRCYLQRANMSQKDLAQRMGVSEQYISEILRGKLPISVQSALTAERVTGIKAMTLLCEQIKEQIGQARKNERSKSK